MIIFNREKIYQNYKKKDLIIEQYIEFSMLKRIVFMTSNSINNSLVKYDDILVLTSILMLYLG